MFKNVEPFHQIKTYTKDSSRRHSRKYKQAKMKKFEVLTKNMCKFPERLVLIQTFVFVKRVFQKVRSS